MLHNSFLHVPSIGAGSEKRIWDSGAVSMHHFLEKPPAFLSTAKTALICRHILLSDEKIACCDPGYFCSCLPSCEHWRIFKEFRDVTAYVDIETTGLGSPGDIITTIALHDGKTVSYYVNGENLDDFIEDIKRFKVIVSYNGKTFDVPFIERFFGIRLPHAHLDLRYILRSLGISGGLKSCERQLGIGRTGLLADVDGFFAVLLWREYKRTGDRKALETLIAYNIEDAVNLEFLMVEAYNRKIREIPFEVDPIALPEAPEIRFRVDPTTVERLKGNNYGPVWR